jgi:hypothetical protein
MTHSFVREALEEYREAAIWYESQRFGLGQEFADALEAGIREILRDPKRFQQVDGELRVFRMKRFPYRLIFRWLEKGHVTIFAVMHIRRRPDYWRERPRENE